MYGTSKSVFTLDHTRLYFYKRRLSFNGSFDTATHLQSLILTPYEFLEADLTLLKHLGHYLFVIQIMLLSHHMPSLLFFPSFDTFTLIVSDYVVVKKALAIPSSLKVFALYATKRKGAGLFTSLNLSTIEIDSLAFILNALIVDIILSVAEPISMSPTF